MSASEARDPVDVLAEEFAARVRRGEHPSVTDYAARFPEQAEQLREVLPAVAQMEQLKRFRKATTAVDRQSLPDRLGDFRIVRELGRGGMDVVFEAVQESLGRRVALKVIATTAQLAPERRERFIREAKAAARLHHTNIVPVFGVGSQDGLPYYVMQLIPGHSLQTVVASWRERPRLAREGEGQSTRANRGSTGSPHDAPNEHPQPDDWEFIAETGAQAAAALQYAHEQGVLHRDVKPANLLLDPNRRVWVADFGVAKIVDSGTLTSTGDILGTLHYLAPECLQGTADPRSDVYGLGATLYELLTLVPPFTAESPARLLKQLADNDPVRPRSMNPDIPRDLETIVLKAMAREPERRYASAEQLAQDLRAYLDDRPIRARRETPLGRGVRWCRRNPAVALLSSTTVAALVFACVAGWLGYVRTQAALVAEAQKRGEAEQASAKLEANLRLCLEAFETVFEKAGGNEFRPPVPGVVGRSNVVRTGPFQSGSGPVPPNAPIVGEVADKAEVLEAVLAFYDKFAEQNSTNPRLQFEAAKAHRRVGEVHQWLGRSEKAAVAFRRAEGVLIALAAQFPESEAIAFELIQVYAAASPAIFGGPEPGAAERQYAKALELARTRSEPRCRWLGGTVHLKLGWAREQGNDCAGAMESYRAAIGAFGPMRNGAPRPGHVLVERVLARQRLAGLLVADNRLRDAERVLVDAVAEIQPWSRGDPAPSPSGRHLYAQTCLQLADVREALGDGRGAMSAREEAHRAGGPQGPVPNGPKGFGPGNSNGPGNPVFGPPRKEPFSPKK